jgi:hypothetical protein
MESANRRKVRWWVAGALLAGGAALALPLGGGADATGGAPDSVTLTSSQSPAGYGQPLVLTATVLPASGTGAVTGTVTFTDGGSPLGTVPLNADGQAALADSTLAAGDHSLQAAYAGSASFAPATSAVLTQVVEVQGSSTLLIAAFNPATYGQVVVVAAVLPSAGAGVPSGRVSLMDGGTAAASASLQDGVAAMALPTLSAGDHRLVARYPGDGNFSASTSPALSVDVEQAETATSLTASPSPAAVGQTVTLTARVTSATGSPTGAVSFSAGDRWVGTAPVDGGTATITAAFDHPGEEELGAAYAGDGDFASSTATEVSLNVHPCWDGGRGGEATCCDGGGPGLSACCAPRDGAKQGGCAGPATTVTVDDATAGTSPLVSVAATPASVNTGQDITLTSVVVGSLGAPFPGGTVEWLEQGRTLGSATVTPVGDAPIGLASLRTQLSAGRDQEISSRYIPTGAASLTYSTAPSTEEASVEVRQVVAPTSLTLASSSNPLSTGRLAIVTATLNHPTSNLIAAGQVHFSIDGRSAASVSLDGLGQAAAVLPALGAGSHVITAAFLGDSAFTPASASLSVSVVVPPPTTSGSPPPGQATSPPASSPGTPSVSRAAPSPGGTGRTPGSAAPSPPAPTASPAPAPGPPGVPPIGPLPLVGGLVLGSGPQIIIFLLIADGLVGLAILWAARRGRRLTRSALDGGEAPPVDDARE